MKRVYKIGHCHYCGEIGHTKRNCRKRAVDEEAAADTDANGGEVNNSAPTVAINGGDAPLVPQAQPVLAETDDSQQVQPFSVRPTKLAPKRKLSTPKKNTPSTSTPAATTQPTNTLPTSTLSVIIPSTSTLPASTQPVSTPSASTLLASIMRFVPNPGFKLPKTKN
ncbi:hypothetical protein Ahy_A06g027858 [Arachis hypogaea]|uniref:CCHC-type domain-containing protein n=1 Tax=Arachis hypogaea TaxID=3818 RepID=A0A445CPZ5_ARAHY|nr:hypothetical protein Ahy_A06g027858 [Arachis hypogaea]